MPFLAKETHPIPTKDLLSWTFDELSYDWDDPIYIDALNPSNNVTARKAKTVIRQLVAGFRALGLKKGDCVNIHSFNDIWYPIFFLGVVAAGGVFAGTNPAYTPHELAHALKVSKAKFVLVQPELIDPVLKASKEIGLSRDKVVVFNPQGQKAPQGFKQWQDLLSHGEKDWERFDDLETTRNSIAALLFSSGTTGLPKAAMLSHYNFIAQSTLVYEAPLRPWRARRCFALPMFHAATAPVCHTTPLRMGEKGYVLSRFDLEKWFWTHQEYEITDVACVPPIVIMAINSPLKDKYSLKSARIGSVGAAPLDKQPQGRFMELLGGAPMTQVWGMTETSCIATRFRYPGYDRTGSVGYAVPNLDLKLVDDDGKDISDFGVRGELCARGPTVIRGYFENPEANSRDFDSEGFFHTGDIAYIDKMSELWYIVDRKKELIKVRGFQVAPPELEGVLLQHPDIVDAAVIGVPDPVREGGELPRGYIVRRAGNTSLNDSEVNKFMRERLSSFKMLEGGIKWVEAIPKNASGKILKRILREEFKKESSAKL